MTAFCLHTQHKIKPVRRDTQRVILSRKDVCKSGIKELLPAMVFEIRNLRLQIKFLLYKP